MKLDLRYNWLLTEYDQQEQSPWFNTFAWKKNTEIRKTIRENTGIEEKLKVASTEWEQIQIILSFVNGLSKHQGWESADDLSALYLFEGAKTGSVTFRCIEFAHMLQHVCSAFGIPARVIGLRRENSHKGLSKMHVVCDVWSNEWKKWIVLDPTINTYYIDSTGSPLSALEINDRVLREQVSDIFMFRSEEFQKERNWPVAAKDNQKYEEIEVYDGFTRDEIWDSLQERGDFQGFLEFWLSYYYYLSYRIHYDAIRPKVNESDIPDDSIYYYEKGTLPKIVFQKMRQVQIYTHDRSRIDIPLNGVEVQWGLPPATLETPIEETRCLMVQLKHSMPWFHHYQVSCNGESYQTDLDQLDWQLKPGKNALEVTPVNDQERKGITTKVEIEVVEVE